MGCNGCELWDPARGIRHCYAGVLTERFAGRPGYPKAFDRPELFTERIGKAARWRDLRGQSRPAKPWLDGYPRLIFFNDMGDTFTEGLPLDWFMPWLQTMRDSPHVWIVLTKRAPRILEWAQLCRGAGGVPRNFWLCVSLTGMASLGRLDAVRQLRQELPEHVLGLSIEPLLTDLAPALRVRHCDLPGLVSWVKVGGESDRSVRGLFIPGRPCALEWVRGLADFFRPRVPVFVKQLGSHPTEAGQRLALKDGHGGEWQEWPADLRVREMPLPMGNRSPQKVAS
jgi:protein gp37